MKILIATKNKKKKLELERILAPLQIEVLCEGDLDVTLPEVEESGETFEENALLKAKSAALTAGMPAVADDSGLCVDALDGAPGVYSARYAGENATDMDRVWKLLGALSGVPDEKRTARFVSAVCLYAPDGGTLQVRGECEGVIGHAPRGEGGFGYDPVFLVGDRSFAELSPAEKDAISHRGKALRALAEQISEFLKEYQSMKTGSNL